jgi:hypothetical protein
LSRDRLFSAPCRNSPKVITDTINSLRFLTRKGFLIEEQGKTYLTDTDLIPRSGPCGRVALNRAGQVVLRLRTP